MNKRQTQLLNWYRHSELVDLVIRLQDALGTGETGDNLVAVARDAHKAEMELASLKRKIEEAEVEHGPILSQHFKLERAGSIKDGKVTWTEETD